MATLSELLSGLGSALCAAWSIPTRGKASAISTIRPSCRRPDAKIAICVFQKSLRREGLLHRENVCQLRHGGWVKLEHVVHDFSYLLPIQRIDLKLNLPCF